MNQEILDKLLELTYACNTTRYLPIKEKKEIIQETVYQLLMLDNNGKIKDIKDIKTYIPLAWQIIKTKGLDYHRYYSKFSELNPNYKDNKSELTEHSNEKLVNIIKDNITLLTKDEQELINDYLNGFRWSELVEKYKNKHIQNNIKTIARKLKNLIKINNDEEYNKVKEQTTKKRILKEESNKERRLIITSIKDGKQQIFLSLADVGRELDKSREWIRYCLANNKIISKKYKINESFV